MYFIWKCHNVNCNSNGIVVYYISTRPQKNNDIFKTFEKVGEMYSNDKCNFEIIDVKEGDKSSIGNQILFFRNGVQLVEDLHWFKYWRCRKTFEVYFINIINMLLKYKKIFNSDLNNILYACGRQTASTSGHKSSLLTLIKAVSSPTYNGDIDSYRDGCEARIDNKTVGNGGRTPLMYAVCANNVELMKELIVNLKCDINAKDR
eukprot:UN24038